MRTIPSMKVETMEVYLMDDPLPFRQFKSKLILESEDVCTDIETPINEDHFGCFILHCEKIKARMIQAVATFK